MKFESVIACSLLGAFAPSEVVGSAIDIFTYYENPLVQLGQRGPSAWKGIELHSENQCGGTGQVTGFGQSPIIIPSEIDMEKGQCDSDLTGFAFEGATCRWDEMEYDITAEKVLASPVRGSGCSLGRMKIPGNYNWFDAVQLTINSISDHSLNGKYFPYEIQVVHRDSSGSGEMANVGIFVDVSSEDIDNPSFEPFLQGWEGTRLQTAEFCAVYKKGTGIFDPVSILESQQMLVDCPAPSEGINVEDVTFTGEFSGLHSLEVPILPIPHEVDFPEGSVTNVYQNLATLEESGIYSYRGGMTTPPCTENVHWNLFATPMYLSKSQASRLSELILCFVERSTCKHGTVANELGGTNRPSQPRRERTVLRRCSNTTENAGVAVPVPVSPAFDDGYHAHDDHSSHGAHNGPYVAVLYPCFVALLAIFVYYILNRYCHHLPYTAVMFMIGTLMGIGIIYWGDTTDQLSTSIRMWENINAEVLLLVFLPGLLFRDAYSLNFHIFKRALTQCLVMAFPMVLIGTGLLACIGLYVLPYGWSFSLAMTFGAILCATDPVAVNALLNEVGAPPRMKTHIAGEALLNDGSAIVFFTIFSSNFLVENGLPSRFSGYEMIDWASGFALFFRMSLGAVAIGVAAGIGLCTILYFLHKRFNAEENVVQVMATVTMAYLTFYVAEPVCFTSGVIAVVTLGVFTKAYGSNMINDEAMMEKFWSLLEHLLNTVLFSLGGVVWGTVISNADPRRAELFTAKDWGYLGLVYILMTIVRFLLFFSFMPIIKNIGLGTNWKEVFFQSWGGLRGAVGIALAIALDSEVFADTLPGDPTRSYTSQLFGIVGGIAFLTLVINGITCGPLLKKLGLADSSESRIKVVSRYRHNLMHRSLDMLLKYLGDPRFNEVQYSTVCKHVPFIDLVPFEELLRAVKRNKATTPPHSYMTPRLDSFKSVVTREQYETLEEVSIVPLKTKLHSIISLAAIVMPDDVKTEVAVDEGAVIELRKIYIDYLQLAYQEQINRGELDARDGPTVFILMQSLALASDDVAQGNPLNDWDWSNYKSWTDEMKERMTAKTAELDIESTVLTSEEQNYRKTKFEVSRTMAFIRAHELAEENFKIDFCSGSGVGAAEGKVLEESRHEVGVANEHLKSMAKTERQAMASQMLCKILLHNAAEHVSELQENNLLREQEAEEYFHEIEHAESGLNAETFGSDVAKGDSTVKKVWKSIQGGLDASKRSSSNASLKSLTSPGSRKSKRKSDFDQSGRSNISDVEPAAMQSGNRPENISIPEGNQVEVSQGYFPHPKDDDDDGEIIF